MYKELVKALRNDSGECGVLGKVKWGADFKRAADAIENISKAYQMLAEAYEAEVTKPRWIPVAERLPDEFKHVLVNIPGMAPHPTVQEAFCETNGMWYSNGFRYGADEITHWMPLPEPPKEET